MEFQKRGRSDDSHEKEVSKAIKAGDGTRVVPSTSGSSSKSSIPKKDPDGFVLVIVDDNNKIDGKISREIWMRAELQLLEHTTYTPEAPAIGLASNS